jgi:murein DD-endopeptidase MepM/ murein hydrolase activator NlpD
MYQAFVQMASTVASHSCTLKQFSALPTRINHCSHKKLFVMKKIILPVSANAFTSKIKQVMYISILLALAQMAVAQPKKQEKELRCGFTKEVMIEMNKRIAEKIRNLRNAGKLNFKKNNVSAASSATLAAPVLFRWPLTTNGYSDFPSWHIGNFVDLNSSAGLLKNYNCWANRTYDGHTGTDIGIDPYPWELKASGFVRVVAAADGIIVDKHDGEEDESCGSSFDDPPLDFLCSTYPNNQGNYVVILHNDGTTATFYMHMKKNSLTALKEGDAISASDYIGTVASAGCSTGPHLHFEVRKGYINDGLGLDDVTGTVVDPFANGSCAQGADSYWISEAPYNDPALLTLETHSFNPDNDYTSACDKSLNLYYDNSFSSGQTIWFRSKFRDWIDETAVTANIYKPNGTLWHTYTITNSSNYRNYIPNDQSYNVSALDAFGTYRYTITFNGKTYSHYFTIGCQSDATLVSAVTGHKGTMVSGTISSTQTITAFSSNYIEYMADGHVTLNPGFFARAGCRFVANTEGCNNSVANANKTTQTEITSAVTKQAVETNEQTSCKVFPNPSSGVFTVLYNAKEKFTASIVVRNMMGQIVYKGTSKEYYNALQERIDISGKTKGIYLVEITSGGKRITKKVLIQ